MHQKKRKEIRKMATKVVKEEEKAEKLQQKQQQKQQKQIEQQKQQQLREQQKQLEQQQKQIEQQKQQQLRQQQKQLEQQQKQQLTPAAVTPATVPPAEAGKKTGFFSRLRNRLKHGDQPTSQEAMKAVPPPLQQPLQQPLPSKDVVKPQAIATATPVDQQPPPTAVASAKETKKSAKEIKQENIAGNVSIHYNNYVCHECITAAEQAAIEREKLFEAIGYSESNPKEEYPSEVC